MFHASEKVNFCDSESDDYVSMDEEEIEDGIQTVSNVLNEQRRRSISNNDDDSDSDSDSLNSPPITLMGLPQNQSTNVNQNRSNSKPMRKKNKSKRKPQLKKKEEKKNSGFFGNLFNFKSSSNNNNNNNNNNSYRIQRQEMEEEEQLSDNDDGWSWGGRKVKSSNTKSKVSSIQSIFDKKQRRNRNNNKSNKKESLRRDRKRLARKKINTNVIALDLSTLDKKELIATGDAYICSNPKCRCILSSLDELLDEDNESKVEEGEKIWRCSFCGTRNIIDIEEEEVPTKESIDYILAPPSDEKSEEEDLIVFCVDVSGSMCVTQAVEGKFELKGREDLSSIESFNEDRSNQWLPNQKKNTTYVSRLQAVQASIDDQITQLAKVKPKAKVALVTFSNEVTIIGDGTQKSEFIAGDKLSNEDLLKEIGSSYKISKSIKDSKDKLIDKLYKLREDGQTALGPALVVSIALASQKSGSQVILCTDGLANIGLGKIDELNDEEQEECLDWYENLGTKALNGGVVVNCISITDSETKLEFLGKVCDISQGNVERINPLELKSNFKGILEKKVLATKCQATMLIHPVLKFKTDEDDEIVIDDKKQRKDSKPKILPINQKLLSIVKEEDVDMSNNNNNNEDNNNNNNNSNNDDDKNKNDDNDTQMKDKNINEDKQKEKEDNNNKDNKNNDEDTEMKGNNNEDNENLINNDDKHKPKENVEVQRQVQDVGNVFDDSKIYFEYVLNKKILKDPKYKDLKDFFFQVKISYERNDGSKMMRVITQRKEVTKNKQELLKGVNMGIMAANASRKTGRMIENGDYESARMYTYMNSVWMSNNMKNDQHMYALNNYVQSNLNVDNVVQQQQQLERSSNMNFKNVSKSKRKKMRSVQRNDNFSKTMYSSKKM